MSTVITKFPPEPWQPHPTTRFLEEQLRTKYPPFVIPHYWIPKVGPDGLRYAHIVTVEEWKNVAPEWRAELTTIRWHVGYRIAHNHPPTAEALDRMYRHFLTTFKEVQSRREPVGSVL